MADALQNREIFQKAMSEYDPNWGYYNQPALAGLLDCSKSHIANLLSGAKPLSGRTKAKLDALIAAKANGPVGVDPLPSNALSRFAEPVAMSTADKFAVIDAQDGTAVLVEIIEPFNNHTAARKICALLNEERD